MSDARKQATEAYVRELGGNYGHDPSIERIARTDVHVVREVFRAGWDARQADLPDRDEWIALFEDQGRWATPASRADAVMSLLRGETKP